MRIQSIKTLKRQQSVGVNFGARPMTIKTNLHDKFYEEKSKFKENHVCYDEHNKFNEKRQLSYNEK